MVTLGVLGVPFGAATPGRAAEIETYTLRLAQSSPTNNPHVVAALHFAAAVARRSKGQVRVEVYPNGQLGSEKDNVDALISGVIDFTIGTSATLVPLFPRYQVLDMPFLFKSFGAGYRVLDGQIGNELFAELESKGIVGLGWGIGGFRQIETTTRAIIVPDDMKGLRIRIVGGAVQVAMYQALGAVPVTIDIAETYTALSQHTIDAMEIPLATIVLSKYYTVIKHVAMSNHILSVNPLLGSKRKIESLPATVQKIIKEEAKAVVPFWRSLIAVQLASDVQALKANGVAFTEIQSAGFRKAMDPIYASVQAKLGDNLIDRISRAGGS